MDGEALLYTAFVAVAVAVALLERAVARRNETRLLREGAVEIAPWVFRAMVPVYTVLFPAAVAEHLLTGRRPPLPWVLSMALLLVASKVLKLWAVIHLGGAWTMKVLLPRALKVVSTGPYRYMRHPNYVAVIGEILALPLLGGAFATALVGGLAFAALLACRVRTEEAALMTRPEYAAAMGRKRRFLPVVLLAILAAADGTRLGSSPPAGVPPAAPADGPVTLHFAPGESSIQFSVSCPGEIVEGRAPAFSGEVALDPSRPGTGGSVVLRVEAAALATGNRLRDRKMRRSHLESDRFPEIEFRSSTIQMSEAPAEDPGAPLRPGEARQALVDGRLRLHGVERPVRFPVAIRYDNGTLTAEGGLSLKLTDYSIPIPHFFLIVLDDEVKVRFRFTATPPPERAPGKGRSPG